MERKEVGSVNKAGMLERGKNKVEEDVGNALKKEEGKTHEENGELPCGSEENVEAESNPPTSPDSRECQPQRRSSGRMKGGNTVGDKNKLKDMKAYRKKRFPAQDVMTYLMREDEGMTGDGARNANARWKTQSPSGIGGILYTAEEIGKAEFTIATIRNYFPHYTRHIDNSYIGWGWC
ncbi:hypothetical protein ACSQ67_024883 [Phaseolus vulgaris]